MLKIDRIPKTDEVFEMYQASQTGCEVDWYAGVRTGRIVGVNRSSAPASDWMLKITPTAMGSHA